MIGRMRFGNIIKSPIAIRLIRGAFWSGLGTILSRGASVIASFCVARFCGKTAFGEYGMIVGTAGVLSSVCGMGVGHTVIKYVSECRSRNPARANRILALSTFVTLLAGALFGAGFFVFSEKIAISLLSAPHLAPLLRIVSFGVILGVVNEVQLSSMSGCEAYKERAHINVLTGLAQAVFLALGSWLWGLTGAVVAYSISYIWMVALTTWYMRPVWRKYGLRRLYSGMFSEWRVLLNFSLPTLLLLLLGMPITWVTRLLLARIPDGYNHLAIVNASTPWGGLIIFVITVVCTALIPVLSDVIGDGDASRALKIVKKVSTYNSFLVVPFCVVVSIMAPYILSFYGDGFSAGWLTFVVVIWTCGLETVCQPMWNFLVSSGMMWTNFVIIFSTAILQIVVAFGMVKYGSIGLVSSDFFIKLLRLGVLAILFSKLSKRYGCVQ